MVLIASVLASPVAACDTALLLAVDVSESISSQDYRLQIAGIAAALQDPQIIKALLDGEDALAMMQWSGSGYQTITLPWTSPKTPPEVGAIAALIANAPRPGGTNTALGRAVKVGVEQFADAPLCQRRVIDVSGDGQENDGTGLPAARAEAMAQGIIVNGLAIEIGGVLGPLTDYYRQFVMTPDGFVMTATGMSDFPRAFHAKLLRELIKPVS